MAKDPQPIYFIPPPKGKPSAWVGVAGYGFYLLWGMAAIIAANLVAWLLDIVSEIVHWFT